MLSCSGRKYFGNLAWIDKTKNYFVEVDKLASILSGEKPIYLNLQFLIRNDKTDPLILKQTKDCLLYTSDAADE